MRSANSLLREARRRKGMSQIQLANRMGVSQAAVARLEQRSANPTVRTLDRALRATGRRLVLADAPQRGIDETLVFEQFRLTPQQRLVQLEKMYEWARELAAAGAQARGERS